MRTSELRGYKRAEYRRLRGMPSDIGDTWVHLRLCRTCGHVGCCYDSKNKHATKHFRSSHHPIVTSLEPEETGSWCYVDEVVMEIE
jgi:uncharacterized UBP type Zn finger protein